MSKQSPEAVFGHVAIWKNEITKGDGTTQIMRSITIRPRQYKDSNGNWVNAAGYNVSEVAHIAFCLSEALRYCLCHWNPSAAQQEAAAGVAVEQAAEQVPPGALPF